MKKTYKGLGQQILLLTLCSGPLMTAPCQAAPTIPGFVGNIADVLPKVSATALPTGGTAIQGIASIREMTASQMEIKQDAPKAVIHWQTFNIGKSASVHFDQQGNAGWKALNAISDANPSQIYGKLSADGGVYLINRNGILFGDTAQVDVHSLTASALNLKEEDFIQGYSDNSNPYAVTTTFRNEDGSIGGEVQNRGTIKAGVGGQVWLIGGKAVNSGTITVENGMVAMAAGDEVSLLDNNDTSRYTMPRVTTTGDSAEVVNNKSGLLRADEGIVGLYGGIVNQNGRVTATTAIARNGQVELTAKSRLTTGPGSETATPVSSSTERQVPSKEFKAGVITVQAKEFIHQGAITSPGGSVLVNQGGSGEIIRLEAGSSIDVSGLWVEQAAADRMLEVQLNSDVLKDAYALKNGPLQGEKVTIDILNGMPAADISAYLNNRPQSAAEQLTKGGKVELHADRVETVAGSHVNFAGGGYRFDRGEVDFTQVRVGSKIYYLSELPAGTPVDEVLGSHTRNHERFGISETWNGVYYGGSSALPEISAAFLQGSDAGELGIYTPYLFMAGALNGWAQRGAYQTDSDDKRYPNLNILALGRRMPKGGTLRIGADTEATNALDAVEKTAYTHAISVVAEAPAAPAGNEPGPKVSFISAAIINNAGLSGLDLHANTILNIAADAKTILAPGGSFNASARQVTVDGGIRAAGGAITLEAQSNKTSFTSINHEANEKYIPLGEALTINGSAFLDTAGEQIDNNGQQALRYGYTKGGSITLANKSVRSDAGYDNPNHGYGMDVAFGSRLSVQGGYSRGVSGSVKGGDAGSLIIRQDIREGEGEILPADLHLTVNGDLQGHALLGNKGGSLTIESNRITVFPDGGSPPPSGYLHDPWDTIVIADNRFARTGFSNITLSAYGDLTVATGSRLEPSSLRLAPPEGRSPAALGFVNALPSEAGATMITLKAGKASGSHLNVEAGASIAVAPKGAITLTTTDFFSSIRLGGALEAQAGSIEVKAGEVSVTSTAQLLANGINLANIGGRGPHAETSWQTLAGGKVTLSATRGSLDLEAGSRIDVSGSAAVTNTVEDSNGIFYHRSEASRPGSIDLKFNEKLTLKGTLSADSYLPGLPGGTLGITRSHSSAPLEVTESLARSLQIKGFDDLRLASPQGINFTEQLPMALASDRRLALDTPQLTGTGGAVTLNAPWVQLVNEHDKLMTNPRPAVDSTDKTLTVNAEFLDVIGNIRVNGFSATSLTSAHAIRLSDSFYKDNLKYDGRLDVAGDLTLQADVVYPTTGSIFTVQGSGLVSVLPQQEEFTDPVFSANGNLTISGQDIFLAGYLAAPMGQISLSSEQGRILLTPESRLSVSGGDTEILYGKVLNGNWVVPDKTAKNDFATVAMTIPTPSISLSGKEVITADGSRMDADGGGVLTAYEFLPGLEGTANPLGRKDRLIIVPDGSVSLPELGVVFVEGYAPMGLAAGAYSILPEEFAFLPGALVLERTSTEAFSGQDTANLLHQPVIAGYETGFGSKGTPVAMTGYVLRTAADVLKEGKFDRQVQSMNDGGEITVEGDTVLMLGAVSAHGAEGGRNGGLTIAGPNIHYGPAPEIFRAVQTMQDSILQGYAGNVYFDNSLMSIGAAEFDRLTLGDFNPDTGQGKTRTVSFAPNQTIQGIPRLEVRAKDAITVGKGTQINALAKAADEGVLELTTKNLVTEAGSLLHASDEIGLNISGGWRFDGDWQVDNGRIRLFSNLISIGSEKSKDPGDGMFLTQEMLAAFAAVNDLRIESNTDLRFVDDITLVTTGSLLLDSQRLLFQDNASPAAGSSAVTINADSLRVQNSHAAVTVPAPMSTGKNDLFLDARSFTLGPGTVRVDGFTDVRLNSAGNLLFEGEGEFQAMLPKEGVLTMAAAGFFASFPRDVESPGANRFTVNSGDGDAYLMKTGPVAPSTQGDPGNFAVFGSSVTLDGALLDFPGSRIEIKATGAEAEDGIVLKNGAQIKAQGGIQHYLLGPTDKTASLDFKLPGGEVLLSAAKGGISFQNNGADAAENNVIDVSALDEQTGGRVIIKTPGGGVDLAGVSLLGSGGVGGSFDLDTKAMPDLGALATSLGSGGFTSEAWIRVREGDVTLGQGRTLAAKSILLAADGENDPTNSKGNINISGTVSASGKAGGEVAIYAKGDLTLQEGAQVEAMGTEEGASGGKVTLGSESGKVVTEGASTIDVTGNGGPTSGGSVTFRVDETETTVGGMTTYGAKLDAKGEIRGTDKKYLQVVKTYNYDAPSTSITSAQIGNIGLIDPKTKLIDLSQNAKGTWIGDSYLIIAGLANYKEAGYALLPEVEVRTTGDLTLTSGFQSGSGANTAGLEKWRPGGLPGVLTFRAGGNLLVKTSLTDTPTALTRIGSTTTYYRNIAPDGPVDSWSMNFTAGANLEAAEPICATAAKDLTIGMPSANNVVVYTESGDIGLTAGRDIKIMPAGTATRDYMPGVQTYTVATFDGDIKSRAGQDTILTNGGVLQSALGDIAMSTDRDLKLENGGAIRTTGRMPTWDEVPVLLSNDKAMTTTQTRRLRRFWEYRDGGDISVRAGGAVLGSVETSPTKGWDSAYWDSVFPETLQVGEKAYRWSANYGYVSNYSNPTSSQSDVPTHGIATMGGGNVLVEAGDDFLAQTGAFGINNPGNLTILAKGDLDGRFLAMQGQSLLSTLGSFGAHTIVDSNGIKKDLLRTGIGIGDVELSLQALGNVEVGTIHNPTLANYYVGNTGLKYHLSYTPESSVQITSVHGNALLSGASDYRSTDSNYNYRVNLLPATVEINAGQNISFTGSFFVMAPAPEGGLVLRSALDINGGFPGSNGELSRSSLIISDAAPDQYYGMFGAVGSEGKLSRIQREHSTTPLHLNDSKPIRVGAGRDISNFNLTLPKQAEIIAARDLQNITYFGQHVGAGDCSILSAGRDFSQPDIIGINKPDAGNAGNFKGITLAGPGTLLLQAGNSLDLANSSGVQTVGNTINPALQDQNIPLSKNGRTKGSDIEVIVGYDMRPSTEETANFLEKLKPKLKEVSELLAAGKESEASRLKEEIRADLLTPFLYQHRSGTGDLNMTAAAFMTLSGEDAINILAAGDVNVGRTIIQTANSGNKDTGILTVAGGPINLITEGDINVNESRVMTFLGGDIVSLSDRGNINAGRGSKAKVTAAVPQIVEKDGVKSVVFSPPAVGSGYRPTAYDPDGSGPLLTPEPGDMYIVAWDGIVDAGEAGFEGGRLFLAATQVLNAQNITVGVGSVGMPAAAAAPTGLGALGGNSVAATAATASEVVKEAAASTASAAEKIASTAKNIAEALTQLRFFVVKFMGFIEPTAAVAAESPSPKSPSSPPRDSVQSPQQSDEEKRLKSTH